MVIKKEWNELDFTLTILALNVSSYNKEFVQMTHDIFFCFCDNYRVGDTSTI